jgi:hypothetical protein
MRRLYRQHECGCPHRAHPVPSRCVGLCLGTFWQDERENLNALDQQEDQETQDAFREMQAARRALSLARKRSSGAPDEGGASRSSAMDKIHEAILYVPTTSGRTQMPCSWGVAGATPSIPAPSPCCVRQRVQVAHDVSLRAT